MRTWLVPVLLALGVAAAAVAVMQLSNHTVPSASVRIFFVEPSSGRLAPVPRQMTLPERPEDRVRFVIDALLSGGPGPGRGTEVPPGLRVNRVTIRGTAVVIDLSGPVEQTLARGSHAEDMLLLQVFSTARSAVPELTHFRLTHDEAPISYEGGHIALSAWMRLGETGDLVAETPPEAVF